MKTVNLQLVKWLCVILIVSLLILLTSLGDELSSRNNRDDGALTAMFFFFAVPVAGYIITIRYCNRLKQGKHIGQVKSRFIFFLTTAIICFLFSVATLFAISFAVVSSLNDGEPLPENENFFEALAMLAIIIYAIVGPVVFFLQLQVRKQLLVQMENSIDWLIDSIGTETNNSDD